MLANDRITNMSADLMKLVDELIENGGKQKTASNDRDPYAEWHADWRSQDGSKKGRETGKAPAEKRAQKRKDYQKTAYLADVASEPQYGYALKLADWLYEQYDIEDFWPSQMGGGRGASHEMRGNKHFLKFGWEALDLCYSGKFRPRLQLDWNFANWAKLNKLVAVHQIVLHEFAHVLQVREGGRHYGQMHNDSWIRNYRELMTLVPYGEFG